MFSKTPCWDPQACPFCHLQGGPIRPYGGWRGLSGSVTHRGNSVSSLPSLQDLVLTGSSIRSSPGSPEAQRLCCRLYIPGSTVAFPPLILRVKWGPHIFMSPLPGSHHHSLVCISPCPLTPTPHGSKNRVCSHCLIPLTLGSATTAPGLLGVPPSDPCHQCCSFSWDSSLLTLPCFFHLQAFNLEEHKESVFLVLVIWIMAIFFLKLTNATAVTHCSW